MNLCDRKVNELGAYKTDFTEAHIALRNFQPAHAVKISVTLLEELLRDLITENFDKFDDRLRRRILNYEKSANERKQTTGLNFLKILYRDLQLFDAIERVTKRSTNILKSLSSNFDAFRKIRNKISHEMSLITTDEAIFILNTIEPFLAYRGYDVISARYGEETAPIYFSNGEHCLRLLLRKIWEFPEAGGAQSSWAVKESSILKGNLSQAIELPGLGIALFTTELAEEVFGGNAIPKIRNCANWGLNQATKSPSYVISSVIKHESTGEELLKPDLRHTIALAILMARSGVLNHQERYLEMILNSAFKDGSWSNEVGGTKSDLSTTVYAVEYLAICLRSAENTQREIQDALRLGQEWLILSSDNGWSIDAFAENRWAKIWVTAYHLQRLLAANLPQISEWSETIIAAAVFLLRDSRRMKYEGETLQFRVEARVAAALSWIAKSINIQPLLKEDIEAWVQEWEQRFLNTIQHLPFKECDLATATFAARALLRNKDFSEIGKRVLIEI